MRGKPVMCWRFDLIDPALDAASEAVVAWYHEDAPVYGLVRYKRRDETFEIINWEPSA